MNYLTGTQHLLIATLCFFTHIQAMNIRSFPLDKQDEKQTCCISIPPLNNCCLTMPYIFISTLLEPYKLTSKKSEAINEIIYGDPECAICIIEYSLNQELYQPPCNHVFDRVCLDQWLLKNDKCPSCNYPNIKKNLKKVIYKPIN